MTKRPLKVYRTAKEIVIPAGAEVGIDPPHTTEYMTDRAMILIEVTADTTAYWSMDLQEAIDEGLVEEVE